MTINISVSLFAVDRLDTPTFAGFIGFSRPKFDAYFTPCIEIGWRLRQEAWNYGFATEGAKCCLQFGFDVLHLPEVYSFTSALNKRSENVMQKIGMQKEGEFEHPGIEVGHRSRRHVLYKL